MTPTFNKTIWTAPSNTSNLIADLILELRGEGTKSSPYQLPLGNIDLLLPLLEDSCCVNLLEGEYITFCFNPTSKTLALRGQGKVIVKLANNSTGGPFYPHIRMITDGGRWFTYFECVNITFDGNWDQQPAHPNLKIQALSIEALVTKVLDVEVINCGANGTEEGVRGLEAMPISVQTCANGDLAQYYSWARQLYYSEPTTWFEIRRCKVSKPHFIKGGTWTGIYVRTNSPANRQLSGTRTTVAGVVTDCQVIGPGGICFGGADVDMVHYLNNIGSGMCAINIDTLTATRLLINGNRFFNCNTGINVSPDKGGSNLDISNNVVHLMEPFYNEVLNRNEPQWGVQSKFTTNSKAGNNTIFYSSDAVNLLNGIDGANNILVKIAASDNSTLQAALLKLKADLQVATENYVKSSDIANRYIKIVEDVKAVVRGV